MPEQLVTLWRYRDLPEALVARAKLESQQVWCVLADDNVVRLDWFWSNAIGGMRLQVADEDAEYAMALLGEEIPAEFTAEEIGEAYRQPECSNCHSRDVTVEPVHRALGLMLLTMLRLGVIVLPIFLVLAFTRKGEWKCEDCGHRWNADYD
jgi:hypothetical protein